MIGVLEPGALNNLDPGNQFVNLIYIWSAPYENETLKRGIPMKIQTIFTAILFICFCASTSSANIYSWVDENGITHFTNKKITTKTSCH
jgi:hypothetical protein